MFDARGSIIPDGLSEKLRPFGRALQEHGDELARTDLVFEHLHLAGFAGDFVMTRNIANERVELALRTQTDRDARSPMSWENNASGTRAVEALGEVNPAALIHMGTLSRTSVGLRLGRTKAVLLYDPEAVTQVPGSPWLYRFVNDQPNGLLAVVEHRLHQGVVVGFNITTLK